MICFRTQRKHYKRKKSVNRQINAKNKVLSNIIALTSSRVWVMNTYESLDSFLISAPEMAHRPKKQWEKEIFFITMFPTFVSTSE